MMTKTPLYFILFFVAFLTNGVLGNVQTGAPWPRYGNTISTASISSAESDASKFVLNWKYKVPGFFAFADLIITANGLLIGRVSWYDNTIGQIRPKDSILAITYNGDTWFNNSNIFKESSGMSNARGLVGSDNLYFFYAAYLDVVVGLDIVYGEKVQWRTNSTIIGQSTLYTINDMLFDCSHAYNITNGDAVWIHNAETTCSGPSITFDNHLIVGTCSGLLSFDASSGDLLWSFVPPVSFCWNNPTLGKNNVIYAGSTCFYGFSENGTYAINARSGEVIWRRDLCIGTPLIPDTDHDRLFIIFNYSVGCINASNGDEIWTLPVWSPSTFHEGVVDMALSKNSILYYMQGDSTICAIDVDKGIKIWCERLEASQSASSYIVGTGLLVIGTDGTLYATSYVADGPERSAAYLYSINVNSPPCSPGKMWIDGRCTLCAAGTYSPNGAYCQMTNYGEYTGVDGASKPNECKAGTFSLRESTKCTPCPSFYLALSYLVPTLRTDRWNANGSGSCPFYHLSVSVIMQIIIGIIPFSITILMSFLVSDNPRAYLAFAFFPTVDVATDILYIVTGTFYNLKILYLAIAFLFVDTSLAVLLGFYVAMVKCLAFYNSDYCQPLHIGTVFKNVSDALPWCEYNHNIWYTRAVPDNYYACNTACWEMVLYNGCRSLLSDLYYCRAIIARTIPHILVGLFNTLRLTIVAILMISYTLLLALVVGIVCFATGALAGLLYQLKLTTLAPALMKIDNDKERRIVQHVVTCAEVFLETIPQLVLLIYNSSLLNEWSTYSILSLMVSIYTLVRTLWFIAFHVFNGSDWGSVPTMMDTYCEFESNPVDFVLIAVGLRKNASSSLSEKLHEQEEPFA